MAMVVVTAMAMEIDGGIADSEGKSQSWKKMWLALCQRMPPIE